MNDIKILRSRLKSRKNKSFVKQMKEILPCNELHHLLGSCGSMKLNDFLLINITHAEHQKLHYSPHKTRNELQDIRDAVYNIGLWARSQKQTELIIKIDNLANWTYSLLIEHDEITDSIIIRLEELFDMMELYYGT